MAVCPYCRSALTLADFELGVCPLCAGKLRDVSAGRPAPAPHDAGTAKPQAANELLPESGGDLTVMFSDSHHNKSTANDPRLVPRPGLETRNETRVDATIIVPSSALPRTREPAASEPIEPGRKTDDLRTAATVDLDRPQQFGELPLLWQGDFDASATPQTSVIKRSFAAAGPNLAIHPRVLVDPTASQQADADYELQGLLGRGGMGVVLAARQASIDRVVALKKLNPAQAENEESRRKFLTEAVVTGDLEHPNIVPIYDLGRDEAGLLFYAMKHVKGTPWNKVLSRKSLPENLEVFMKVADAVAFAHSRGVVHRDLKPENVMLGGYGEVLVMDWGLAIKTNTPAAAAAGVGGTPAYMAPEMMTSRPEEIGPASDVYLLGGILYEILTGTAPHAGKTVQDCLLAVLKNVIAPTDRSDELVVIARNAMATRPEDRYGSVSALQDAIRLYQSHSQSVLLSTRAEADLHAAEGREDYEFYARALLGFQEAYELWDGNEAAKEGIAKTSLVYAERALSKENFDLAASLLDESLPEQVPLLRKVRAAQREHNARRQRLKTFKRIGFGLVATILFVISGAFIWIRSEYQRAERAKDQAESAKVQAEDAKNQAEASEQVAKNQKHEADIQREAADKAKLQAEDSQRDAEREKNAALSAKEKEKSAKEDAIVAKNSAVAAKEKEQAAKEEAVSAKEKEAYGAYVARIGLASAKIDENAFDRAAALLAECPSRFRNWEWGRLMHLCRQSDRTLNVPERVETLAISPDGKRLVAGGESGTAQILDAESGRVITELKTAGQYVFAAAFSPDGARVALGTNESPAYLQVFDAATGQKTWEYRSNKVRGEPAHGHEDAVLSVAWSHDGRRLLTGSYDNTARLWDVAAGTELRVFRGHDWWVWSAAFSPDERWIVTASQDGTAMVWDVNKTESLATFRGHTGPVYAAAFAPQSRTSQGNSHSSLPHMLIASAGYDKRVLLWYPDSLHDFDYRAMLGSEQADSHMTAETAGQRGILAGHTAAVKALCFSSDGKLLASAGNDNSVRIWNVESRQIVKTLRGHGGRVHAVAFGPHLEGESRKLFSAGHDQTVKVWDLHRYEEMRVIEVAGLDGQRDAILGADFSAQGDRIITAGRDRTARIWDRSGKLLLECKEGHEYLVSTAACFPDGKRLLTAAVDSTARIWNLASGGQSVVLKKTGPSAAAAISHDGRWVLTGGDYESDAAHPPTAARTMRPVSVRLVSDEPLWPAKLWDAESGKLLHTLSVHRGEVTAVAFSADDDLLFTADANGRGSLWNRTTGALECAEQKLHSRGITAAAFLPHGEGLLTAGGDNTVVQWDVTRRNQGYVLTSRQVLRHPDAVSSMAVSPDGKHVFTTCSDRIVRLWNLARGELTGAILADRDGALRLVDARGAEGLTAWRTAQMTIIRQQQHQLIEDGASRKLSAAAIDARTAELDQRAQTVLGREEINSVAFSPSGEAAVTTATDGTVRLWDWIAGREIGSGDRHATPAYRLANGQAWSTVFSTNGDWLITVGGSDARLWDRQSGREAMRFGPQGAVAAARFSPTGDRVVTASWDDTARIWNAASGRVIVKLQGHTEYVNDAIFSRDGTRVLTASDDNTARLWDAMSGKQLVVFRGHAQRLRAADLFCDPATGAVQKIVTASDDGTARIWDAAGNLLHELAGHSKAVLSADFSTDGTRVLTGGDDNRAILWDTATGKQLMELDGHTAGVTSVGFSPDGLRAVTGSRDNTVKIWELQTGKELLTLKGHNQEVTAVSFSPDQRSVLTGGLDGAWILWDAAGWEQK